MPISASQLADDVVSVLKKTTILTDAQIKALPTTRIELVPAQGVNKAIILQGWVCSPTLVAPYTNIQAASYITFEWMLGGSTTSIPPIFDETSVGDVTGLLSDGIIYNFGPQLQVDFGGALVTLNQLGPNANNGSITIEAYGQVFSDFTGGNAGNSLKITVFYMVVDL